MILRNYTSKIILNVNGFTKGKKYVSAFTYCRKIEFTVHVHLTIKILHKYMNIIMVG